jgi:hypothetical protein
MGSISLEEENSARYDQSEFSAPMSPEHNFQDQFDNEDSNRAASDYAR